MNELESVWYMISPQHKKDLNKRWAFLFPTLCTGTRERSKDIWASFEKGPMAVKLIFQKPLVLPLAYAESLAAGLKT